MPAAGSKRHKDGSGPSGSPPSGGNFHQPPSYNHFQQAPYGQQQYPMQHQQPGYNMWQPGQQPPPFANQGPPYGQQAGMYRQPPATGAPPQNGPPMTPDRSGPNWNGYRGPPPPQQQQGMRQNGVSNTPQGLKGAIGGGTAPSNVPPIQQPPVGGPQQFQQWGQPQQPWPPQGQWGGAPPAVWQQGPHMPPQPSPPPPNAQSVPQHLYPGGPQGGHQWAGGNSNNMTTPARPSSRLRSSPENGFPPGVPNGMTSPVAMCKPVGLDGGPGSVGPDGGAYVDSRQDEDGKSKSSHEGKGMAKDDKGRGSYRCGRVSPIPRQSVVFLNYNLMFCFAIFRLSFWSHSLFPPLAVITQQCGVPKKGHICPYQPKLKRRPDEPPPVLRNAAIQVEMDEVISASHYSIICVSKLYPLTTPPPFFSFDICSL